MSAFQFFFIRLVNRIETNASSVQRYVFLFFAILALRLTLEFFSNNRLFTMADVIHISLWFIFIVLAFLIQLLWFSKEKIERLFKLVITCFSIALTAPIIDMFVANGIGIKMNYLTINSWQDLVFSYFTIGGASLNRGATLGIRIEIVILVVASFNYVYTKTKRLVRSLLAAFCIYTILFFSGALPFLLGILVNALNLNYTSDDNSTTLALLTFDLLFVLVLICYFFPQHVLRFYKLIVWWQLLSVLCVFFIGAAMARYLYPNNWQINPTSLWQFPLILLWGLGYYAYLFKIKYRAALVLKHAPYAIENGLLIWMVLCSLAISYSTFFVALLNWGLLFFLYESPLRLYRFKFLYIILSAMLAMSFALYGFVSFNAPLVGFPKPLLLSGLFLTFSLIYFIEAKPSKVLVKFIFIIGLLFLLFVLPIIPNLPWFYKMVLLISALPFSFAYIFTTISKNSMYVVVLPIILVICYSICLTN